MLPLFTMDSSKTLDNDCSSTEMSRLKSSMFTTAALAIVLLSNHTPINVLGLQEPKRRIQKYQQKAAKIQLCSLELPEINEYSVKRPLACSNI